MPGQTRAHPVVLADPLLVAYVGFAVLLTVTPGPDMALVTRNAIRRGWAGGARSGLGVCAGLVVHATAAAVGLSVLLARSALLYDAVRIAGALYLVYLGAATIRRSLRDAAADDPDGSKEDAGHRSFAEGLVTNVLNPKVAIFYVALLPQFVRPADPFLARAGLLAGIHIGLNLVWLPVLARVVAGARDRLPTGRVGDWLERATGGALIAVGARLALGDPLGL